FPFGALSCLRRARISVTRTPWGRVYNFERFSIALHGETHAEKLYRLPPTLQVARRAMTRRALCLQDGRSRRPPHRSIPGATLISITAGAGAAATDSWLDTIVAVIEMSVAPGMLR